MRNRKVSIGFMELFYILKERSLFKEIESGKADPEWTFYTQERVLKILPIFETVSQTRRDQFAKFLKKNRLFNVDIERIKLYSEYLYYVKTGEILPFDYIPILGEYLTMVSNEGVLKGERYHEVEKCGYYSGGFKTQTIQFGNDDIENLSGWSFQPTMYRKSTDKEIEQYEVDKTLVLLIEKQYKNFLNSRNFSNDKIESLKGLRKKDFERLEKYSRAYIYLKN